jgi:phosphate transport system permease protein
MQKRIAARYSAERRFRTLGLTAIVMSAGFLAYLLISMLHDGLAGFTRTEIVPHRRRCDRSDAGRHLGRVQGFAADHAVTLLLASRSACSRRSILRNMRPATAGPT